MGKKIKQPGRITRIIAGCQNDEEKKISINNSYTK